MDKTAKSLIDLLTSPDPQLRLAAMRVVVALDLKSKGVTQGLAASLDAEEESLRIQALRALAQLGAGEALPVVAPKILEGGAVRQHAVQVLTLAGTAAIPVLRKLYAEGDFHARRAIASTLGAIGGPQAFQFLLQALPSEDLEMIKHLTACLRQSLETMKPPARLAATRAIRAFLRRKTTLQNPHATIAGLILLGGVSDARAIEEARTLLLQYLDRKQPEPVRRNAAVSLSRLPVPPARAAALVPRLLPYLCEPEWTPVPQNVLPLLQRLELPPATVLKLVPLLRKSPHVSVQGHVLERLQGLDKPALANEALPFLTAPHPRLRDAAEVALKAMPSTAPRVFDAWVGSRDADMARRCESILRSFPEAVRRKIAAQAADRMLALHEKDDSAWRTFLEFVRGTDPTLVQKRVAKRLQALRASSSAKRFAAIQRLLGLLWDENLIDERQRYEYGLVLLRKSRKDVAVRGADPALRVLSGLARQRGAELVRSLAAERHLGAEDYYYLGFHLAEAGEDLRPLGAMLLETLVQRYPRHRLRRAAKQKLDLQSRLPAMTES